MPHGPRRALLAAMLAAAASSAPAQEPAPGPPPWSAGVSAYVYLQEDDDFVLPVVRADRGALHLEGRYQYEDLETGSLWAGWTLSAGTSLRLDVTPMAGIVFGQTDGVAPGLELTLAWRSLELYSESEYVLGFEGRESDFFYNWSELAWQARPWLRLGLSVQRTRLYESEREVDRGLFAAVGRGPFELVVYGFNLDGDSPFAVVGLAVEF